MTKKELFELLRRNSHFGRSAVVLISDFLCLSWSRAIEVYKKEYLPTVDPIKLAKYKKQLAEKKLKRKMELELISNKL